MNFATLKGLTIPEGVVTQIADASGRVIWEASGWPNDLDTGLEFASASAFSISASSPGWDGTMEYCNGDGEWKAWDGSAISSGKTQNGQAIYIRGTGNTVVTGNTSSRKWTLTGTDIACNGNIETLLDYATVKSGTHPTMADYCYQYMFNGCTSLTTAPALPATTLADYCYISMFSNCTSLTTAPALPATTLAIGCYNSMFSGCKKIKLSSTKTGTYTTAYRIPYSGTGTTATYALTNMFNGTGGTFTGAPTINKTYYLDSSNTIV